jgi:TPR repeat protein
MVSIRSRSRNPQAQYELGVMYSDGSGVDQDFKEAMKWLLLAAPKGIAPAHYKLGIMYKEGRCVERNFNEAEKWLRLAVVQGVENVQYQLGVLLLRKATVEGTRSAVAYGDHR